MGLPGILRHQNDSGPSDSSAAPVVFSSVTRRHARVTMEQELQDHLGCEVVVMSGAEANGFGEMLFGAGKGKAGLVMMLTLVREQV